MAKTPTTVNAAALVAPIAGDNPTPRKLAALPKLPKAARKAKPPVVCSCGCGNMTKGGRFVPGHDGRLHGWVLRVERGVVKLADIPDGERQAVAAYIKAGGTSKPTPKAKAEKASKAAKGVKPIVMPEPK